MSTLSFTLSHSLGARVLHHNVSHSSQIKTFSQPNQHCHSRIHEEKIFHCANFTFWPPTSVAPQRGPSPSEKESSSMYYQCRLAARAVPRSRAICRLGSVFGGARSYPSYRMPQ